MVQFGARQANQHYETLIEQYDLERGVTDPPAGLNESSRQILAGLLEHAATA